MRNFRRRHALVGLLVVGLGCRPGTPPSADSRAADEAAIRDADIAWCKTAQTGNLDSLVTFYADDVVVLPPNAPAVIGKQAARELNKTLLEMPGYKVNWQPEKVEVTRSGDMGYARGIYELTVSGPTGAPVTDKGKYVEIWKKQPDGRWKVIVESLNSDLPAVPAPAPKK